jgi:hypothetical protein
LARLAYSLLKGLGVRRPSSPSPLSLITSRLFPILKVQIWYLPVFYTKLLFSPTGIFDSTPVQEVNSDSLEVIMIPTVWLITGCSSGFGASLALLALRNGHHVIATSRNPSRTPYLVSDVEKLGGKWLVLDVCDPNLAHVVEDASKIYGKIDILVNNAGYALLGAFEAIRWVLVSSTSLQ